MKSRTTAAERGDREFRRLVRDLDGVRHRVQVERLGQALTTGSIRVEHAWWGMFLNRLVLRLVDGPILALRLFYPAPRGITALTSIRWDERIGWVVGAVTGGDAPVVLYAFSARTIERSNPA